MEFDQTIPANLCEKGNTIGGRKPSPKKQRALLPLATVNIMSGVVTLEKTTKINNSSPKRNKTRSPPFRNSPKHAEFLELELHKQ